MFYVSIARTALRRLPSVQRWLGFMHFATGLIWGCQSRFLPGIYRTILPLPSQHEAYLDTFFALWRIQLMSWVIESRDHPAFRKGWVEWARNDLQELAQFVACR